jgi:tetratricopeptide (TPR) repeat protein
MNVREATIHSENVSIAIANMTNEEAFQIIKYSEACISEIQGLSLIDPPYICNQQGLAYAKLSRYREAIESVAKAISRLSKSKTERLARYHSNRAIIYILDKQFDKGIVDCIRSNELYQSDPTFAATITSKTNVAFNHLWISEAYVNKSDVVNVINHIEIALNIYPLPAKDLIEIIKAMKLNTNIEFILNANCSGRLRAIIQENLIAEANAIQSQNPGRAEIIRFYLKLSLENLTVVNPNLAGRFRREIAEKKLSDGAIILINKDLEQSRRKRLDAQVLSYTKEFESCENDHQAAQIYNARGVQYATFRLHKRAVADFNETIKFIDESNKLANAIAYFNSGLAFINDNEFDKSIADFSKAISLSADYECFVDYFSTLYLARAYSYIRNLRFKKAIDDMNKASLIHPNSYRLKQLLSEFYPYLTDLHSNYFLQVFNCFMQDECSGKFRELIHECLIKSSRGTNVRIPNTNKILVINPTSRGTGGDPNNFSFEGHAKLCDFYLKLSLDRQQLPKVRQAKPG